MRRCLTALRVRSTPISRSLLACGLLALSSVHAGCSQAPATELVVEVDTDYPIPAGIDQIDVDVTGPDGMHHVEHQPMISASALPYTLTVLPAGASLGPVRVEARGLHAGTVVVTRTGRTTLVQGQSIQMVLVLLETCGTATRAACTQPDTTCTEDGQCHSIDVPATPWVGPQRFVDAGPMDAGSHDASAMDANRPDTNVDAGPPPDMGITILDSGPLPDAGGDCHVAGCADDGNPCTDQVCGTDGTCTITNNTIGCDDHVFCNGMDTCGGGSCSQHVGNPCGGGTTCDEAGGRCVGCTMDSDCPAQMTGAYGACSFGSSCATSGTQSRTVRTFHCASNSCVPSDSTEMQACTRTSTDGMSCGTTSCPGFGACGGFSGTCGTTGTQSRTCTDLTCSGGSCAPVMRVETQGCARSTDGTSCMATSCGGFGACGGFADTCANAGTQSRTCTDYTCGSGSCNGATRTDTQGCTRNTDGTSCGTTSCGGFGACPAYLDACTLSTSY